VKLQLAKPINDHWPSLAGNSVTDQNETNVKSASSVSYSVIAQKLKDTVDTSALSFKTAARETKKQYKTAVVCGKAGGSSSTSSLAVDNDRRIDIFVSRLRPETSTDEVVSLVNETFPTCCSVKAVKLDTRFNSYSSFQVEIYVKRSEFDIMLSSVYMEDNWPYGVLVRRFFRNNKNGVKK